MSHVFVATPTHDQMVHHTYCTAWARTQVALLQRGLGTTHSFMVGSALVHDARNRLVTRFLAEPEATDLLFIDADIGWRAEDAVKLALSGCEVIGGAYPRKLDGPLKFNTGEIYKSGPGGLLQVDFLGTGFLKIKRAALERMIAAHPEWKYTDDHNGPVYSVFDTDFREGRMQGEDVLFCRRWRGMGGKVFLDPDMTLQHTGPKTFIGNMGDIARQHQESRDGEVATETEAAA